MLISRDVSRVCYYGFKHVICIVIGRVTGNGPASGCMRKRHDRVWRVPGDIRAATREWATKAEVT